MDMLKNFIRKNLVFLGLLCAILMILIALTVYLLMNNQKPSILPPEPPPVVETPPEENAVITSFSGKYGKDEQVRLDWTIKANNAVITSVQLFHNGVQLGGEMKDLNSYSLLQSIYRFSTGNNTFTLKVSVENGEVIEKDVVIFVNYVFGASMSNEKFDGGIDVKLTYEYDKNNTVGVPRLQLSNPNSEYLDVTYVDTKKTEVGNHIRAEVTYRIGSSRLPTGNHKINVRWIFDGINTSYDYTLEIIK